MGFFKKSPASVGLRFENAHCLAQPVPSLEELCFRAVRRHWKSFAMPITAWADLHGDQLRDSSRDGLARMQETADIVEAHANKKIEEGGSDESSSGDETGQRKIRK